MNSSPDFQSVLSDAVRRQKLRLAARAAKAAMPLASSVVIGGLVITLLAPEVFANSARLTVLLLAIALLAFVSAPFFRRMSPIQAAKVLDRDLHLPDSGLAWVQFPESGAWWDALRSETMERLLSAVPPSLTPEKRTLAFAMIFILTLLAAAGIWVPSAPEVLPMASRPTDFTALDEVFEDWSAFSETNPGRAGEEIKTAAQALELALKDRAAERSDLLARIATVEDRLQATLSSMDSLQALLPALTEALSAAAKPFPNTSSPAPSTSEALDQLAAQLPANFQAANPDELEELARQMSGAGHDALADALRDLAKASDGNTAQEALTKLSQALSGAEALADARRMMELAEMQLAAAKEGTSGNSEGALSLLPKLSELGNPGSGAGSGTDVPEPTTSRPLDAAPLLAPVTGKNQSAGEARVQVLPSADGLRESPARAPSDTAARGGPLSEEAISAESLPVVHRATVRRYFEAIRPKTEKP